MSKTPKTRLLPLVPVLAGAALLTGCAQTMAPGHIRPQAPVAAQWPTEPSADTGGAPLAAWQDLFADPALRQLVQQALHHNRDLRVAALNIERARAQYGISRSQLFPTVDLGVGGSAVRTSASLSATGSAVVSHSAGLDVGISAYELDLFGRVRSLKDEALQQYLGTVAAQGSARIGLVAAVAATYLGLAADTEQLELASDTLRSRQEAYDLQRQLGDLGSASDLATRQAEVELEAARDQHLLLDSTVAMDRNVLELLVGSPLPRNLRPTVPLEGMLARQDIPAGLPSDLLQRRPDIVAAEHALLAANASIGAARAAFYPSIRLTAGIGRASDSLSGLFEGGNRSWSFVPQVTLPVFTGGRLRAGLEVAEANRDLAVANYERAIQSAFREVADALAVRATLEPRLVSQQRRVDAAQQAYALVRQRYDAGVSSYIEVLDAQRTLYTAQQGWIGIRLARQSNLVTLYKALGGDWPEVAPTMTDSKAARTGGSFGLH